MLHIVKLDTALTQMRTISETELAVAETKQWQLGHYQHADRRNKAIRDGKVGMTILWIR